MGVSQFGIIVAIVAYLLGMLAIVIVSLLTPAPDKSVTDIFDRVASM